MATGEGKDYGSLGSFTFKNQLLHHHRGGAEAAPIQMFLHMKRPDVTFQRSVSPDKAFSWSTCQPSPMTLSWDTDENHKIKSTSNQNQAPLHDVKSHRRELCYPSQAKGEDVQRLSSTLNLTELCLKVNALRNRHSWQKVLAPPPKSYIQESKPLPLTPTFPAAPPRRLASVVLIHGEWRHSSIRKRSTMFLVSSLMGNNIGLEERVHSDLPLSCSLITERINLWSLIDDQEAVTWSSSMWPAHTLSLLICEPSARPHLFSVRRLIDCMRSLRWTVTEHVYAFH